MMSGPEACDCDYGFFANHIPGSLNQCKMDYSCNANQHTADEVSNWNIENFKLSSLHYSDNHPEPLFPRYEDEVQFTGFQINSDSLRSASISTEHLHQDLSDAFNSCLNTYCLCSFANVQHQIQDISDCTKCKKFQTYHHDRMRPSPRKLKSINSNAYPFIISNRSAVHNCGLIDHDVYGNPDTSTETKNQLKYMLPYQEELPNISCESGDVAAKEIERIERHYGGRLRTQRAAKIIQNAYRDYRLRVEYSRLRLEKGVNRVAETKNVEVIVQDSDNSKHISTQVTTDNSCMRSGPLDDVNDLVIDRAYIDWSLEASVNQIESHNSTFDGKFSGNEKDFNFHSQSLKSHANSQPSGPLSPSMPPEASKIMSNKYLSPDIVESHIHKQDLKVITSDMPRSVPNPLMQFDSQIIQPSRGNLCNNSVRQSILLSNPQGQWNSPTSHNISSHFRTHVSSSCGHCCYLNHHSAESIPKSQGFSPSERDSCTHKCLHFQKYCLPPRIPGHPSIHNSCPYCVCVPSTVSANKSTLVCIPAPLSTVVPPCSGNGCPVISYPIGKVCKTPPASIPPCPPLNSGLLHLNSRHIMPTAPTVMSAPQMESHKVNKNESFQRQYPNHMSCQNQCAYINVPTQCRLHLHPPFLPYGVPSQTIHPSAVTSFPFRNPCVVRLPNAQEKRRKRAYRVGLNIFNKSPVKGIEFLIKNGFIENSPQMIARFLLTRKGLSRVAIGDYLGNTKNEIAKSTTRQFIRELDFRNQEVDEALRLLLGCFRTPGESQKIVHLLNEFQAAYVEQNSTRVKAQFRSSDTVMILAYAIVMLHTDMYSPNVRPQSKMTQEEFVRNLRGVDSGEDLDRDLLFGIYERIKSKEMSVLSDHTDQVRKIQQHLTGPLKPLNLSVAQRRLVCYCRLYEVPDKNKRERSGAHQRELFLFNDLLLITKAVQKRRKDATIAYQVRMTVQLLGVKLVPFETVHHPNGLELLLLVGQSHQMDSQKDANINNIVETPNGRARILVTLNTKTSSDRARLMEDLQECILEVTEMERLRMEDVSKQKSTYTQNHCASHKMRTDVIEFTKSGPVMLDKSSLSFDSNTSVTTNINKSVNHKYDHDDGSSGNALQMCAPITCLTNTTELRNTEQTKHIQHHCHRYKSSDGQRLSGDSGLMADLDTPAS
ncbi:unnamed protein product [Heterobilharzia americana]|nr:unnamed protein product [Heterobilharzia americana]